MRMPSGRAHCAAARRSAARSSLALRATRSATCVHVMCMHMCVCMHDMCDTCVHVQRHAHLPEAVVVEQHVALFAAQLRVRVVLREAARARFPNVSALHRLRLCVIVCTCEMGARAKKQIVLRALAMKVANDLRTVTNGENAQFLSFRAFLAHAHAQWVPKP